MCNTHNSVGSLAAIKSHLLRHSIKEFNSINQLITFQKNYLSSKQKIISNQKILIEKEKQTLFTEISQLDAELLTKKIETETKLRLELEKLKQDLQLLSAPPTNIINLAINYFKKRRIKNKILTKEKKSYR